MGRFRGGVLTRMLPAAILTGGLSFAATAIAQPAPPPAAPPPAAPPPAAPPPTTDAPPPATPPPATPPPATTAPATDAPPPAAPEAAPSAAPAPPPGGPPGPPPPSLIPDGGVPKGPIAPVFPPAIPNIDYGGRIRGLLKLQNPQAPKQMNVPGQEITADLYMSGQVHRYFKWLVSVEMSYKGVAGETQAGAVEPLDLIARFEPMPEFNIYLGRMLVVVDRFAPAGPWGVDEFFFPGFFPLIGPPALPKAGPIGRDVGTSIWGAPLKGHIKYYVGMFNLNNPNPGAHPPSNPLFNGRLQVSLLNGEPNWFHRSTYYGSKDLISAGVGTEYQRGGSAQPAPPPPAAGMPAPPPPKRDDYQVVHGDLTVEKNIGDAGTASLIGEYTKFIGDYNPWKNFMLAEAGYMLPEPIGIGKPRLSVRYQRALAQPPGAKASQVIDVQLSYLIAAWYTRLGLGYRHGDSWLASSPAATKPSNMLYLGVIVADP